MRTASIVLTLLLAGIGASCSPGDDPTSGQGPGRCDIEEFDIDGDDDEEIDQLSDCLAGLEGVTSAEVNVQEADNDYFIGSVVVEMAEDTAEQVYAAALEQVDAAVGALDMEKGFLLALGDAEQDPASGVSEPVSEETAVPSASDRAALLYRAREVVTDATAQVAGGRLNLYTDGTTLEAVTRTASAVAADPELRRADVGISTDSTGNYPAGIHLSAQGLDASALRHWRQTVAALDLLAPGDTPESLYATFGKSASIELVLDTPDLDDVPPVAKARTRFWPATRRLLDITWSVGGTHELAVRVAGDFLVHLSSDLDAFTHVDTPDWHRLAQRHVGV